MSLATSVLYNRLDLYNNLPVFMQNLVVTLYGYFEYRNRYSRVFHEKLEFMRQSQWFSHSEIENYKDEQLSKLAKYVYNEVPYYRELFKKINLHPDDIRTTNDLHKIPILTKEEVRANYKSMLAPNFAGKYSISHTSGSTGKPLDFYLSSETIQFQWAVWWRFRERFGVNFGDKSLNFTGKPLVPTNQRKPPFWRVNKKFNQFLSNMQQIKEENIPYYVDLINREGFSFFTGYPSILYALADMIEQSGLTVQNGPKFIMTGAEKLFDFQKEKFERVFHCQAVDQYGFSEAAANASRCEKQVFHEDFEFGILELTGESEEKDVLATGFSNYAMPLIRYEVGDTARPLKGTCSCGRHSAGVEEFVGRHEDYVITPEGTRILRFDYIFKELANVKECQVRQRKSGEVEFLVVARDRFNSNDEEIIRRRVAQWISPTIKVHITKVKEIPRTRSGKFRAVVSELN